MNPPSLPMNRTRKCSMLLVTLFAALIVPNVSSALAQMAQGMVTVHVLYRGAIPSPIDMTGTRDPETCGTTVSIQSVMVHSPSGGLKNVVAMIEGVTRRNKNRHGCRRWFCRTLGALFCHML